MKRLQAFVAMRKDLQSVMLHDPAVRSKAEAVLCYAGLHALVMYRFFHFLHVHGYRLAARLLSALTKFLTGIEIHPAAKIGHGVFIDHGAGVVIGETAEVGNNVVIYQGVTLGGTGKDKGKRHPTVRDNVTLSSGAKLLGPFTVGAGAKIGAGAVVLCEVPPNATVVGVPGRIVRIAGKRLDSCACEPLDPVKDELDMLADRIDKLEKSMGRDLHDSASD